MYGRSIRIVFDSPQGNASLFLNGFLMFGAENVGRASSQAAPFLRPGSNVFELVPEQPNTAASLRVLDVSQGGPQNAGVLLQHEFGDPGVPLSQILTVEEAVPNFAWHQAEVIENVSAQRRSLYRAAETIADLLTRGPDQDLLAVLDMKHAEMALSLGLSQNEMDDGLMEGLSNLRERPEFRAELAVPDDFLPLLSSDGRIVTLRRMSGGDAIRIIDGVTDPGFSVAMARIAGRWQVVR